MRNKIIAIYCTCINFLMAIHHYEDPQCQLGKFFLTLGAVSDVGCLDLFDFDLPEGPEIYADRIYNDY